MGKFLKKKSSLPLPLNSLGDTGASKLIVPGEAVSLQSKDTAPQEALYRDLMRDRWRDEAPVPMPACGAAVGLRPACRRRARIEQRALEGRSQDRKPFRRGSGGLSLAAPSLTR